MTSSPPSVLYNDNGEKRVVFTLPPAKKPERDSVLVFAMPKSGSSLLNRIMQRLSNSNGLIYVSIMGEYYRLGMPGEKVPEETRDIFLEKGYCYGGFRYFPNQFEIPIIPKVKKLLLVRDPRDVLVSHYYSMRESHPEPGSGLKSSVSDVALRGAADEMDIDAFAKMMAPQFRDMFGQYKKLCEENDVRIYRYEDVIYKKSEWISDICGHLGWRFPLWIKWILLRRYDVFPKEEDTGQHIRQVHPGNYKKKLAHHTVKDLTDLFSEEMKFFNYV